MENAIIRNLPTVPHQWCPFKEIIYKGNGKKHQDLLLLNILVQRKLYSLPILVFVLTKHKHTHANGYLNCSRYHHSKIKIDAIRYLKRRAFTWRKEVEKMKSREINRGGTRKCTVHRPGPYIFVSLLCLFLPLCMWKKWHEHTYLLQCMTTYQNHRTKVKNKVNDQFEEKDQGWFT